jgi:mRNA interferase HigB
MGTDYIVHVIKRKTLIDFYEQPRHHDAKGPLEAWYYEAKHAQWASPAEIKDRYRSASILKGDRVVFNIAGNKYRLVVKINYGSKTVFVRFIGTHREYDKIDAEVI